MKNRAGQGKKIVGALLLGVACCAAGCGDSAQRKAYERACQAEQTLTAENASEIIAEYRRVVAWQPDSAWAEKSRARIEALEAKLKADELHQSVFQEHGID